MHCWTRSLLFVPGNDERRAWKALQAGADAVVFDLEDAVPAQEKDAAAALVRRVTETAAGGAGAPGPALYVRVNGADSGRLAADVVLVVHGGLTGVMLPKAESADQIARLDELLTAAEAGAGAGYRRLEILPLIESALGLERAAEIGRASPRVRTLVFGALDYTRDVGATWTPEGLETLYARSRLVAVARAAGLSPPLDTVYPLIDDAEGLRREASLARRLGFAGKLVIHPSQVGVVTEVFSPSDAEIAWAQRVVAAYEESLARGQAVVRLDGQMVDTPVVDRARRILDQAVALGLVPDGGGGAGRP